MNGFVKMGHQSTDKRTGELEDEKEGHDAEEPTRLHSRADLLRPRPIYFSASDGLLSARSPNWTSGNRPLLETDTHKSPVFDQYGAISSSKRRVSRKL